MVAFPDGWFDEYIESNNQFVSRIQKIINDFHKRLLSAEQNLADHEQEIGNLKEKENE